MFIFLVLVLLRFSISLAIKPLSIIIKHPWSGQPTFIDLNPGKLHYYPFVTSMTRCNGSWFTNEDTFGSMCVSNRMEDINLKVFVIFKGTNESKTLAKCISCEFKCELDIRKCNSKKVE